jgi:repressor LexA
MLFMGEVNNTKPLRSRTKWVDNGTNLVIIRPVRRTENPVNLSKIAPNAPIQMGLTQKQRACLDAIEAHLERTRTMPSVENLRLALGFTSKAGVLHLLRQLEERGRIKRLPNRACAIQLLKTEPCAYCADRLGRGADVP